MSERWKDRLKVAGVCFMVFIMLWSMLTTKMYETEKEQRLYCVAQGGTWIKPEIRPWNLVEGECK
jgi:hypothetical protein